MQKDILHNYYMEPRQITVIIIAAVIIGVGSFWGCSTEPPVTADLIEVITGSDSTIEMKFVPQLSVINKTVLIEDFANVSCMPCVISNRILETLTKNTFGYASAAVVKYPTNFPSPNDPFYLANSAACEARRKYYNVFAAPTNIIDGILKPAPADSNDVKEKIQQRLAVPARFKLTLKDSIAGDTYFIKFSVEIKDTVGIDFNNLTCNIVVTETEIEFSSPPGSNGETKFYDVMRVMFPSDKQKFRMNSVQPASVINMRQVVIDPKWKREKLHAVIFIQDKATKEIIQAGSTFK